MLKQVRTTLVLALAAPGLWPTVADAAPGAPASATRFGLSPVAYQKAFDQYTKAGLKPTSVSGYVVAGKVRYAATWRAGDGPARSARHGLTEAAMEQEIARREKDGFRAVHVNGFRAGKTDRFAAIFEQRTDKSPVAVELAQGTQSFDATFAKRTKQGWRLRNLSAWDADGTPRFAAVYERSTGPAWVTHTRMTAKQYQSRFEQYGRDGMRLRTVSGYVTGGQERFAALWEKASGPAWRARHGVAHAAYGRTFESDRRGSFYPVAIQAYEKGKTAGVNVITASAFSAADLGKLEAAAQAGMTEPKVSGLSIAIARGGRLLFAGGFGKADVENDVPMDALHRIRIGSTSKTITSAAIFRLIQQGRIDGGSGRKVFGPGGLLEGVAIPESMKSLEDATIGQFLAHVAGLPPVADPVNCKIKTLEGRIAWQLAEHAKTASPVLLGPPGAARQYSNFSNIIAEAVIERVTKRTYRDYVRTDVLAPAGITSADLFKIGDYSAANGEAKHYTAGGKLHEWDPKATCDEEPPGVGAGGWAMNAYDLQRFLVHHDGRPQRELLTPELRADMLGPVVPAMNQGDTGYAKSWGVGGWSWCGEVERDIVQGHNGWLDGGWSDLHELDDGFQIAVIANRNGAKGCERRATERVVSVLSTIDWPDHDLFG